MKTKTTFYFTLLLLISTFTSTGKGVELYDLTCEYFSNPVGIGTPTPRFAWKISSDEPNQVQTAYQLLVATSPKKLNERKADLWNSGKVESDQSIQLEYAGEELSSKDIAYWKVRVWDKNGKRSSWSEVNSFEIGLLDENDWSGNWIKTAIKFEEYHYPALLFRKEFKTDKTISKARIYISALGMYELYLNGQRVGKDVFTPGWTSYDYLRQYQVYDVSSMLLNGENAIGVHLGNGWYRAFRYRKNNEEEKKRLDLAIIAQLEVTYDDGTVEVINTDKSWKSTTGPVRNAEIYNGETYDARMEQPGWNTAGFNDENWEGSDWVSERKSDLVAAVSPPVRKVETIKPIGVIITPEKDTVIDMGQNLVGWVRFKTNHPKGHKITLKHAEVLDKQGNFYTANLRAAKQRIEYTSNGKGEVSYEPHFAFMGFRYVKVSGWDGEINLDDFEGIVLYSDMKKAGDFVTDNTMINQLQHNIVWGQKGNFVDVPTDCPQRDERLGWTGDTQVFGPTACFNMQTAGFYTKWLRDLKADQQPDGLVPNVIPCKFGGIWGGAHGWADAAVIVPWTVYTWYGDTRILEEQYKSMTAWIGYMTDRMGDDHLWETEQRQFGDWLAFATTRSDYPGATTDKDLLANAYFYRSTHLLQKSAEILGKKADAQKYSALKAKIKADFLKEYVTPNGRLSSNTQTAYVVCLAFGLLPEEMEANAAKRLADDVNKFGHITTGFLGTPDICHVLTKYGYLEEAYKLLLRKEYPSWLYPITKGATTIWERWDGIKTDGSFQNTGMNSFNHYAYGAIGSWLYQKVAGISPKEEEPGFKSFIIKPHPGGDFKDITAEHDSPYGKISSKWNIADHQLKLEIEIPVNTTAEIYVPSKGKELIMNGEIRESEIIKVEGLDFHFLKVKVGSGRYTFQSEWE